MFHLWVTKKEPTPVVLLRQSSPTNPIIAAGFSGAATPPNVILWLRNELRLRDNPLLQKGLEHVAQGATSLQMVVCFLDESSEGLFKLLYHGKMLFREDVLMFPIVLRKI